MSNDPFIIYPHLAELKKEVETVPVGTQKYWKLRCGYLEKHIDPTYSDQERRNCFRLWDILRHRE